MKIPGTVILYGVAAIAIGVGAWYVVKKGKEISEVIPDALEEINPLNSENVFARGADALAQKVTGDPSTSFGSLIYDLTHPRANDAVAPTPLARPGTLILDNYIGDLPLEVDGVIFAPYVGDLPLASGRTIVDGSGGAAFGLYPNPFRSKP